MASKTDKLITEMLSDLIEDTEDIEYVTEYGKEWGFKQINAKEYLNTLKKSQDLNRDELTRLFGMQIEILKYALVYLEGIKLTDAQKTKLLENVSPSMINVLYNDFEEIRRKKEAELAEKVEGTEKQEVEIETEAESGNTVIDA